MGLIQKILSSLYLLVDIVAPGSGGRQVKKAMLFGRAFTKWDSLLLVIPGMTLLATGVKFLKNPDAIHYLEIICYQGNGWLKHISLLLAISGSVSVFAGIFRVCVIQLKTSQETLLYLVAQGCFLLINLSAGLATVSARDQLVPSMTSSMSRQMSEVHGGSALRATSNLAEVWDSMQMTMKCCGAEGFNDYIKYAAGKSKEPIPRSCCVLRRFDLDSPPEIENLKQCQMDAKMGVHSSIYIHMRGCRAPLQAWTAHFAKSHVTMLFTSACSQVLAMIYVYLLHTKVLR